MRNTHTTQIRAIDIDAAVWASNHTACRTRSGDEESSLWGILFGGRRGQRVAKDDESEDEGGEFELHHELRIVS
jgi:hypothetical protein